MRASFLINTAVLCKSNANLRSMIFSLTSNFLHDSGVTTWHHTARRWLGGVGLGEAAPISLSSVLVVATELQWYLRGDVSTQLSGSDVCTFGSEGESRSSL